MTASAPFAKASIGATPLALSATEKLVTYGVLIVALPSNTGVVYVGDSTVTTSIGIPLVAGQSIYLPRSQFSDAAAIYVVGSAVGQEVRCWVDLDSVIAGAIAGSGSAGAMNLTQVAGVAFALGQALAASSLPAVLPAIQEASLKQPVLQAGTAIVGKVTTDQTTHGTTDLVAADITKIAGTAVPVGHGVAATAMRVELPTDGTGVVGLVAGTALVGKVGTDQTTHGTTDLVAADITKMAGAAVPVGHGVAATAMRVELPTDGTGTVGLIAGSAIAGKFGIDQTTPGTTNGVQINAAVPAGENHLGEVGAKSDVISVTLTLDTNIYASGDLIADTQELGSTNALRVSGGTAILQSLTVIDEDDQGVALSVYVSSSNATAGSENSAPSIADADARSIQAIVDVGTSDYKDLGGVKVAQIRNIGAVLKGNASRSMYVFVVNSTGTPTFTASGVKLVFGILQD